MSEGMGSRQLITVPELPFIINKTQPAVTRMRLNKRRTKTGVFFSDLTKLR